MSVLPRPDGVVFDCDSTLSRIEGIDALAAIRQCESAVAALTDQAMNGETPLEAVYQRRLDLIRPERRDLDTIAERYLATRTPGAQETIAALHCAGIAVAIVSGGLRAAIIPLAAVLGVAAENVFAVALDFDPENRYCGIVPSPLTTAIGKRRVVADWKMKHRLTQVCLVGDGMSDVCARGADAADTVIGYGGVVSRPAVRSAADAFYQEHDLRGILAFWGMTE